MEGVAEEEEVDDQLLWNLQILSEVDLKSGSACDLHSLLQNGCDYWCNAIMYGSVISVFPPRRRQRER